MDNSSVNAREMLAPRKGVNQRATRWWPLVVLFGLQVMAVWIILISLSRSFTSLFKKKKSVSGAVVLITGAGRGLGRSISMELAKLGAKIVCVDIHTKNNEETARLINSEGGTAEAYTCNIAKSNQVEKLKIDVLAKYGAVDIVINNAALLIALPLREMSYDDIRGMYEVNNMGPAFMTAAFLPSMIERNSGHLVAISSVGALASVPFIPMYCSTKSGLSRFFDSVRVELDINPVNELKVTNIHPFFVNTSADYVSWFETYLPILEENYVARCIVDAVLYEKESVGIPAPMMLIKIADALVGSFQYNIAMKFLGNGVNMPTKSDREQLPYSSIITDISTTSS